MCFAKAKQHFESEKKTNFWENSKARLWHGVEGAGTYRLSEASTGPHLTLANEGFFGIQEGMRASGCFGPKEDVFNNLLRTIGCLQHTQRASVTISYRPLRV